MCTYTFAFRDTRICACNLSSSLILLPFSLVKQTSTIDISKDIQEMTLSRSTALPIEAPKRTYFPAYAYIYVLIRLYVCACPCAYLKNAYIILNEELSIFIRNALEKGVCNDVMSEVNRYTQRQN